MYSGASKQRVEIQKVRILHEGQCVKGPKGHMMSPESLHNDPWRGLLCKSLGCIKMLFGFVVQVCSFCRIDPPHIGTALIKDSWGRSTTLSMTSNGGCNLLG